MIYDVVIVHYGEIGTKGKNRPMFENQLVRNIQVALKGERLGAVRKAYGRILIDLEKDSDLESIRGKLSNVFGVVWFAFGVSATHSKRSYEATAQKVFDFAVSQSKKKKPTFRVNSRRSNKEFPLKSMQLNKALADKVNAKLKLPVNLSEADITLGVDVLEKGIICNIANKSNRGPGGMPPGVSGKVLILLSGGIDSPVAAYQLMKRGCRVNFVHYHGEWPDKIKETVKILNKYQQYNGKLHCIPFKPLQMEIIKKVPPKQRLLIYRRFMFRIAEQIAQKNGIKALATGESIAQVASQTIENIGAVDSVVSLPVFRPVLTWDKQEIVDLAQKIGTYGLSIQPYEDCCSLFVPKHPELRATSEQLDEIEKNLDIRKLLKTI